MFLFRLRGVEWKGKDWRGQDWIGEDWIGMERRGKDWTGEERIMKNRRCISCLKECYGFRCRDCFKRGINNTEARRRIQRLADRKK